MNEILYVQREVFYSVVTNQGHLDCAVYPFRSCCFVSNTASDYTMKFSFCVFNLSKCQAFSIVMPKRKKERIPTPSGKTELLFPGSI